MKKIVMIVAMAMAMTMGAQASFLSDFFGIIESTEMAKSTKGFSFNPKRVKTEYSSRIIWGAGYTDHNESDPVKGVAVEVYGTGWKYTTVTDENGEFTVPVKPNSDFSIRASSGDYWATYEGTLSGVPKGTLKIDKD